jgi:glycosyltransferase involved in cell wall biosynthesis
MEVERRLSMSEPAPVDISICICTYNRRASLLEALGSVRELQVPRGLCFEVLVVDNNSSDGTSAALEEFDAGRLSLRHVIETRQGLSHARNRAISETTGRVIAFLDDDVIVDVRWLTALAAAFSEEPAPAAVGGPARIDDDRPRPRWWHEEFAGVAGHFDGGSSVLSSHEGYRGMIGIGANLAFDRRVFERYGGFRTDLGRSGSSLAMGEELELLARLRDNDERLVYDPAVVVHHRPDLTRMSKSYLRRWYFRFGEWRCVAERESRGARWLAVPRWHYRTAVADFARWLQALVMQRPAEALLHQLHVVAFGGYLRRAWRERSARPPLRDLVQ